MIRRLGGWGPPAGRGAMDSDAEESYKMGDKVEARFKGGAKWHPGRIDNVNRDGTYDVRYDDGDQERRVESRMIRRLGGAKRSMDSDMDVGVNLDFNADAVGDTLTAGVALAYRAF